MTPDDTDKLLRADVLEAALKRRTPPTTRGERLALWGEGPWIDEPDHVQFEAFGLPCIIHRAPGGAWCGYVGVAPGHPCHGKHFDEEPAGGVFAHGGLSYSAACQGHICHVPKPGESEDVWWLGFDCAHCDDLQPALMQAFATREPTRSARCIFADAEYRDQTFVTAATTIVAAQLAWIGCPFKDAPIARGKCSRCLTDHEFPKFSV